MRAAIYCKGTGMLFKVLAAMGLLLTLVGCGTLTAPAYQPSVNNTRTLMQVGKTHVAVGEFKAGVTKPLQVNRLSLRAYNFVSPYNESFVEYLREAVKIELENAGMHDAASALKISGELQANTLDISGASKGKASAMARFVVSNADAVRYDKVLSVEHQWDSSFIGGIAIPTGAQNYAAMVQKLVGKLFADEDFKAAVSASP